VRRMSDAGAHIKVAAVDVTVADQVTDLVNDIGRTMPPLSGIFHAAMVLDDGYLLQLDQTRFERVMGPKVTGTWNLHQATLDHRLDYFVMFSSVAAMTGQPGQGNYCAANAFMDAFAHYRRARSLPALTVNWGVIADAGYVSRNADIGRFLERQGLDGLKTSEAEAILEELLRSDRCQVAAVRVDFQKLAASLSAQSSRRFSHLLHQDALGEMLPGPSQERGAMLSRIRAAAPKERGDLLQLALRDALANVLKISGERIDADQAFGGLGLDSLMAVELEARVKSDLGINLSMGFLAGGEITLRRLTERLLDQVMAPQAA
jgi:acyl carrier protein